MLGIGITSSQQLHLLKVNNKMSEKLGHYVLEWPELIVLYFNLLYIIF